MSRILECFTSRWGGYGRILELDFKQLEIRVLAYLSQDKQLTEDINNGLDIHSVNAALLYNMKYDDFYERAVKASIPKYVKMRKVAKGPGFLIQYGGGAATMAKHTGLSKEKCQKFIDNYYTRYPGVKAWQDEQIDLVKNSRKSSTKKVDGVPVGYGILSHPQTGMSWKFYEKVGEKKIFPTSYIFPHKDEFKTYFSPTTIKNYPIQGFASAIVVAEALKILYNFCKKKEGIKLIGTVHDSIILDIHVHQDTKKLLVLLLEAILFGLSTRIENITGVELNVDFPLDVSIGKSWAEAKRS